MAVDALGLIAGAIGSALQSKGAKKAAAANQEGQEAAAEYAMEGSQPWDVSGSLGDVKFDSEGKAILSLSPELKAQQEAYLNRQGTYFNQQDNFFTSADANRNYLAGIEGSPLEAAQRFYEQEMALVKPEQEIAREQLDAQLLSQGMLGSSGGAARAAALAQAQGNVRLKSRQTASDRVQNMIDQYRARISGDVTGALDLGQGALQLGEGALEVGQQPLAYGELGLGIGGMLSKPAMLGSQYLSGAALTNANMIGGRYGGWGNALQNLNYSPAGPQPRDLTRQQSNLIKYGANRPTSQFSGFTGGRGGRGDVGAWKSRI